MLVDPKELWERRYSRMRSAGIRPNGDPWLARWRAQLEVADHLPILDLGCGSGQDAAWLLDAGFRVISGDYCQAALKTAAQAASEATFLQMDLRDGLPFPQEIFNIIVAGLCLHYFTWEKTQRILAEVFARLRPGGYLLARVNSIRDVHHGAVGHEEIEPGCYRVDGELKHFFDGDNLQQLFAGDWILRHLEETTIHRYRHPKIVWEIVAEKRSLPLAICNSPFTLEEL